MQASCLPGTNFLYIFCCFYVLNIKQNESSSLRPQSLLARGTGLTFPRRSVFTQLRCENTETLTIHGSEYLKVRRSCTNSLCLRTEDKKHTSPQEHFQYAVLDTEILSFTKSVSVSHTQSAKPVPFSLEFFLCFLRHKFTWSEYNNILEPSFFQSQYLQL